jgi:hypothetical protein
MRSRRIGIRNLQCTSHSHFQAFGTRTQHISSGCTFLHLSHYEFLVPHCLSRHFRCPFTNALLVIILTACLSALPLVRSSPPPSPRHHLQFVHNQYLSFFVAAFRSLATLSHALATRTLTSNPCNLKAGPRWAMLPLPSKLLLVTTHPSTHRCSLAAAASSSVCVIAISHLLSSHLPSPLCTSMPCPGSLTSKLIPLSEYPPPAPTRTYVPPGERFLKGYISRPRHKGGASGRSQCDSIRNVSGRQ